MVSKQLSLLHVSLVVTVWYVMGNLILGTWNGFEAVEPAPRIISGNCMLCGR